MPSDFNVVVNGYHICSLKLIPMQMISEMKMKKGNWKLHLRYKKSHKSKIRNSKVEG
jgi:hypothetical protein